MAEGDAWAALTARADEAFISGIGFSKSRYSSLRLSLAGIKPGKARLTVNRGTAFACEPSPIRAAANNSASLRPVRPLR